MESIHLEEQMLKPTRTTRTHKKHKSPVLYTIMVTYYISIHNTWNKRWTGVTMAQMAQWVASWSEDIIRIEWMWMPRLSMSVTCFGTCVMWKRNTNNIPFSPFIKSIKHLIMINKAYYVLIIELILCVVLLMISIAAHRRLLKCFTVGAQAQ